MAISRITFLALAQIMVLSHIPVAGQDMKAAALPTLTLSSASRDRLLEIVEPRLFYHTQGVVVNGIAGMVLTCWATNLVFLTPMMRANSEHVSARRVISRLMDGWMDGWMDG